MLQVQISLFSNKGYRPLSTIVTVESVEEWNKNKKQIKMKAVATMCAKRRLTRADLEKYGYNEIRSRQYDKEKIEQEKKERYEQIKKERGWS